MPIPTSTYRCDHGCCIRTFVPLDVAYARTIHKFQGLSAGPVDNGKVPNMYECIICDPDEKKFEGSALGLLYTAVSRATTLGDDQGLGSAIYFTGSEFKERRIRRLTKLKDSDEDFKVAQKRQKWVEYLSRRESECKRKQKKIKRREKEIHTFINNTQYDYDFLYRRIQKYKLESYNNTLF